MKLNVTIKRMAMMAILPLLVGCTHSNASYTNHSTVINSAAAGGAIGAAVGDVTVVGLPMGVAVGAVMGGAIGKYLESRMTLVQKLQARGVYIIIVGENVKIVFPSDGVFVGYTDQISPSAFETLNMVAELLRGMTKVAVDITTYAPIDDTMVAKNVTAHQALALEKYYWRHGVDARLLVARGAGNAKPMNYHLNIFGRHDMNYRVEVTLKDYTESTRGF